MSWDYVGSGSVDLLPIEDCILGHIFVHHDQAAEDDDLFKIVDRISSDLRGTSFEVRFVDRGNNTIMIPESELLDMV